MVLMSVVVDLVVQTLNNKQHSHPSRMQDVCPMNLV